MQQETHEEEWKSIPGYEGHYEASSLGRIRSLDRYVGHNFGGKKLQPGRVIKQSTLPKGYKIVRLQKDGAGRNWRVPRLVLMAFVGDEPALVARHRDCNPENNKLSNLQWGTHAENEADKIEHGTKIFGERSGCAILSESDALSIMSRRLEHRLDLALEYGVSESTIRAIWSGRSWKHLDQTDWRAAA